MENQNLYTRLESILNKTKFSYTLHDDNHQENLIEFYKNKETKHNAIEYAISIVNSKLPEVVVNADIQTIFRKFYFQEIVIKAKANDKRALEPFNKYCLDLGVRAFYSMNTTKNEIYKYDIINDVIFYIQKNKTFDFSVGDFEHYFYVSIKRMIFSYWKRGRIQVNQVQEFEFKSLKTDDEINFDEETAYGIGSVDNEYSEFGRVIPKFFLQENLLNAHQIPCLMSINNELTEIPVIQVGGRSYLFDNDPDGFILKHTLANKAATFNERKYMEEAIVEMKKSNDKNDPLSDNIQTELSDTDYESSRQKLFDKLGRAVSIVPTEKPKKIEPAPVLGESEEKEHPKVGAVLVDEVGNIIGRSHRLADGRHCENTMFNVVLKDKQIDYSNTTLYVTLEPCSCRNPNKLPCAVWTILAGVKRVVIGMLDPNPDVEYKGVSMLLEAGIEVDFFHYDLSTEVIEANKKFIEAQKKTYLNYKMPKAKKI